MTTHAKVRILVVDDEPSRRLTLEDILTDEGYDVSTAADGQIAVDMCTEQEYDVVIMDVRMPRLDGIDAFRQVRRHREGVRIIMMSAYGTDELKQMALEEGAIAFLDKPLNLGKVIRLISEATGTAILVVADDESTAARLGGALEEQGYHVRVVHSPHEAMELAEQIRFDIVFIDVELPSMNGLDLYLAIKKITPTAVAIMISGMEEEFERLALEAVRRTAYTVIRKPIDLDYLLAMLQRIDAQRISNAVKKPKT